MSTQRRRVALLVGLLFCAGLVLVGLALVLGVAPAGMKPVAIIRWKTASEVNTAGFNLYRGNAPDGPFTQRINEQLIPASTSPLTGGSYVYTDTTVQPGRTYFYELEEVENDGTRARVGRISVRAEGSSLLVRVVGAVLVADAVWLALYLWYRLRPREQEERQE
ncbi:MAG: hypothetical protein Q9O62_09590 [Ardenticatenia bacterium]|nr:hypothetical protein [Ardenticatenia bacterium]